MRRETDHDGSALGGAGDGDERALEDVGRGAGPAAHLALEGGHLARHRLLRLERVLEVALRLATLRLLARHLLLGLVQLALQGL